MTFEVLGGTDLLRHRTAFEQLFRACFQREFSAKDWNTLYQCPPVDASLGVAGFANDGALTAFYGMIPQELITDDGQALRYWLGVSLMIHPEHRGLAQFLELIRGAQRAVTASDRRHLIGFPNQNSLPLLTRFCGWRIEDHIQFRAFDVQRASGTDVANVMNLPDPSGRFRFPYDRAAYADWRRQRTDYEMYEVGGALRVAIKRRGAAIEVLDAVRSNSATVTSEMVACLCATLGVARVIAASPFIETLGLSGQASEDSGDRPMRLAVAPLGDALPPIRFSALMSDVV